MSDTQLTLFWMRRDLRLQDNAGLYEALKNNRHVLPVFIFDSLILDKLQNKKDLRVQFIYHELSALKQQLNEMGSDLLVLYGKPLEIWEKLIDERDIKNVYTNHDYEPYAIARDEAVSQLLAKQDISLRTFKDQCIFEKDEVLKADAQPYTVFTPYFNKWREKLKPFYVRSYPTEKYFSHFYKIQKQSPFPGIHDIGFEFSPFRFPAKTTSQGLISNYKQNRDYPAIHGTSHLSLHFRFGTISIREKMRKAIPLSDTWVKELAWRDFYMQILAHFPHVASHAFKPAYDKILWRNNEQEFEAWKNGKTGYPLVDAGMRELNSTGFMHNRIRMVVASFLCKHLLIDWRWGEAYFAEKLLDFDLASNNGGWQWASGSGVDSAPYFRIFNPTLQMEKFDPKLEYVRQWVPEYGTNKYPSPIVEHTFARQRCLEVYKAALNESS
jgi:deoxyribodipyrimidine photo-lyase